MTRAHPHRRDRRLVRRALRTVAMNYVSLRVKRAGSIPVWNTVGWHLIV